MTKPGTRPHSLNYCPIEILHLLGKRGFCLRDFMLSKYRLTEEPCCNHLWPRQWQSPVVSLWTSCRRVGCLHKHTWALTQQTGVHTHECVSTCVCVCSSPFYSACFNLLCQSETPLCRIYVKATISSSPAGALGQTKGLCPLSSFFFRVTSLSRGLGAAINRREPHTA